MKRSPTILRRTIRAEPVIVRELREAALALAEFPEAYALVPRYERYGVRRKPYGNYAVFYEIVETTLFVTHILNSAQDYQAILFPDD